MANILWVSTFSAHDELNDAAKQVRNMLSSLAARRANVVCLTASVFTSMNDQALTPVLAQRIKEESSTKDLTFNVSDNGVMYLYCKTQSYSLSNMITSEQRFVVGQMFPIVCQFKPDLVITSCTDIVAMSCMNIAKSSGIPTAFVLNEPVPSEFVFQDIDVILSATKSLTEDFVTPLGRTAIQIGNFLPIGRKSDLDARLEKLKDSKNFNKRNKIVLVSPTVEKGLGVFLRIAQKAQNHDVLGKYEFCVLEREDGQFNASLDLMVDGIDSDTKLNADDFKFIKLLNASQDVDSVLGNARLVVMPTLSYASTSETALKAMSHGVPVVTTDQSSLVELLGDGAKYIEMAQEVIDNITSLPDASIADAWMEAMVALLNDEEASKRALIASSTYDYDASCKRLANALKPLTDIKASNNPQLFRSGPCSMRIAAENEMEEEARRQAASERENSVKASESNAVAESKAEITN